MKTLSSEVFDLPKIRDTRGNLSFIESGTHIPFEIVRIFYLYDVPGGESRAGHALKSCHQVLIAASGSFDVLVDDGLIKKNYHLSKPSQALHIRPNVWRVLENFSSGSVCLVLASERYDESGYFRNYDDFIKSLSLE